MDIWIDNEHSNLQIYQNLLAINGFIDKGKDSDILCRSKFPVELESQVLNDCENTTVEIKYIEDDVVAQIPVVLSKFIIKIVLSSVTSLPYGASNIIEVKNKVKIEECKLINDTGVLFISGIVTKNICFNSYNSFKVISAVGPLRNCIIDIPFNCTTDIDFNDMSPSTKLKLTSLEYTYSSDPVIPNSNLKIGRITTEHYNHKPYCCLLDSRIVESIHSTIVNTVASPLRPLGVWEIVDLDSKAVVKVEIIILEERDVLIRHKRKT